MLACKCRYDGLEKDSQIISNCSFKSHTFLQIDLHLLNQHHLLRLHTNFIVSIFLGFHTILLRICIFFSSKTSCCFRSCDCSNFTVDSVSLIGSFFSIQQSTIVVYQSLPSRQYRLEPELGRLISNFENNYSSYYTDFFQTTKSNMYQRMKLGYVDFQYYRIISEVFFSSTLVVFIKMCYYG